MPKASTMNRRSFLKRAAAASVATATVPMILPQNALGANDRVVLGMIGVGVRGSQLIGPFSRNCRIAAVSDVYLPRAREVAASSDIKDVYQDYRELLERKDIDAVVIATPLHWHGLNCLHAAQAGKDIFCEKPLAYSIAEGRRIVDAVRKYKRVFQTGVQGRLHRNAHTGCLHVRNGTIGRISRVIAHNYASPWEPKHSEQAVPDGLDWDRWCGPAERPPYNYVIWDNRSVPSWVSVRPFSGSSMTDWGSHGLDLAQWGLGMDESGPEEVWVEGEPFKQLQSTDDAPGSRQGGPRGPEVHMKYPGDIVMQFAGGVRWQEVRFIGEKGTINVTRDGFSSDPSELMSQRLENPKVQLYRGYEYALKNDIFQDWLNCIKERRDPAANAEVGQRTVTICHLANIARWVSGITGETGQKLKWDAEKERFTNSPEANRFLDPPRRKGYELPDTV